MVKGTINGFSFQTALESDGKGSHWFRVDYALSKAAGANNPSAFTHVSSHCLQPYNGFEKSDHGLSG
jgi:hypothetical protein